MSDPLRPALRHSVFARLVAVMSLMGAVVIAMVGGFYFVIVIPGIHDALDSVVGPHARAIADMRPDSVTAHRFAERLGMGIRFESPDTTWATAPDVPTLGAMQQRRTAWFAHLFVPRRAYYIAQVDGGRYIFARGVAEHFSRAHAQMVVLLLALMATVFVAAYLIIRRALRPLRLLGAGVGALAEGRLDIAVPRQGDDELGLLTDAFNRMARRVHDMVRSRERLLRDVSHELRSPITRLKVALEMLPEGPQQRAMAADVVEMETMVAHLLELERLREGGVLRREPHDLVALAREAIERTGDRPPGVRLAVAPGRLVVPVDADGVRTVLRNLIDNAIKYSLPDSRPVEVSLVGGAESAVVRITDDGPGLPEGDLEKAFEPFYRGDPSRSRSTGGYGLGLSICRGIMEAHGGTIAIEPGAGRGATIVLWFPREGEPGE